MPKLSQLLNRPHQCLSLLLLVLPCLALVLCPFQRSHALAVILLQRGRDEGQELSMQLHGCTASSIYARMPCILHACALKESAEYVQCAVLLVAAQQAACLRLFCMRCTACAAALIVCRAHAAWHLLNCPFCHRDRGLWTQQEHASKLPMPLSGMGGSPVCISSCLKHCGPHAVPKKLPDIYLAACMVD